MGKLLLIFSILVVIFSLFIITFLIYDNSVYGLQINSVQTIIPEYQAKQVAINLETNTIYIDQKNSLYSINSTGKTITKIKLDDDYSIHRFVINQKTNTIFALCTGHDEIKLSTVIYVINSKTNKIIKQIQLSEFDSGGSISINTITNKIYATTFVSNILYVIDGNTHQILNKIPIGEHYTTGGDAFSIIPAELFVDETANKVYVTNGPLNLIDVIDGKTDRIISTITSTQFPTGIVSNNKDKLYVSSFGVVYVLDNITYEKLFEIPVEGAHNNLGLSINNNSGLLYITSFNKPLSIIDTKTNKLLKDEPINTALRNVVVNPNTNAVYWYEGDALEIVFFNESIFYKDFKTVFSPLRQSSLGIPVNEIHCKEELVLITKLNNNPACVTPQSAQKLVERGWGTSIYSEK